MNRSFWQAGHTPTLLSAFLYFDLSFMVWYLLGPLQVQIAAALQLETQQRALMVAMPILCGAVLRLLLGMLADVIGAKRAGMLAQVLVIVALAVAWQLGVHSFAQVLLLGLMLGVAGASFAVALPLASRWYPPQHQGTAMGIAGAGNSGTVFAALFAPALATAFGYQAVFGLACIPLLLTLLVFALCAKDAPVAVPRKHLHDYVRVLVGNRDSWWFMLFYAITFGGFAGFASALPGYFHDQFDFSPKLAGWATAACVLAGSVMRPLGGALADRIGGTRTLLSIYLLVALLVAAAAVGVGGPAATVALFVMTLLCLGTGNGAVFQLVPQRFGRDIGLMTGLIGMAGGIGGFLLAAGLGIVKQHTGSYALGLWLFAGCALLALGLLSNVKQHWRSQWAAAGAARV
ncbi:NarK/NasA family nitrate transporter [Xanthomonas translucens pv. undulosa]|nr:major facilitator superfamily protein [Xanthomonas translucens DAR61454]MQS40444.1 NarK/NasA family nitrate transporter [Xanthomonas translucens pv. translucens]OAX59859.1 MFS transporter [Xanthomonas translucens pv. translucens]QEN92453.1 NarK/NasA family nitrate transporter [Xanthomonas translucens pv. undulosa]QEO25282.1 NarK/NasA family nitrate transporter [Xanthomonas translucens pv. undulosa]